jgi:MraZ protein
VGGPKRVTDDSFLGNALNGIDAKNRVSIPAGFRDVIAVRSEARTVILAPAERADCLVGYDPGYPAKARAELEARFAGDYSDARDDRFRATFGAAEKAPIDDNGRIILSQTMKDAAEIDRVALFWGMGDFFEVWNPHRFVERPNLDPRIVRMVRRLLDARGAA